MFDAAAAEVGDLRMAIESLDAASIVQGGDLGRQVVDGIDEAAAMAMVCRRQLERAADICRERALVMANYELELAAYDEQMAAFEAAWAQWDYEVSAGGAPPPPDIHPPVAVAPPSWLNEPSGATVVDVR